MINDSYSRDSSIKIRSQLEIKRKKGDFIGSFVAFGYKKSETDRNRIEVDEQAANVVRDIFKWKIDGMSQQGIATKLNETGILSPMEYKRFLGEKYKTSFKVNQQAMWSAVAVKRILTNELYIGILEQGKRSTPNYKIKAKVDRPKSEWVRVEGTHEPIISKEEFKTVNGLMQKTTRISPFKNIVYPFSGIIACGDCKENMIRKTVPSNGKNYYYFTCSSNRLNKESCTTHSINENDLTNAVLDAINLHTQSVLDIERMLDYISTLPYKQGEVQKLDAQILRFKDEIEKIEKYKLSTYENYLEKVINIDEYNSHIKRYNDKLLKIENNLSKRQNEIEQIVENSAISNEWLESFKEHRNIDLITRKIVAMLIEKIYIFEGGKISIEFKYQAQYDNSISYIETAEKSATFDISMMSKGVC